MGRHLDWHFSMNKRDARNIKQTPSRAWFMPCQQWILTEDAMVDIVVPVLPSDSETPVARVCHTSYHIISYHVTSNGLNGVTKGGKHISGVA
jgi:hypothetical protein